jgi:hypothetical protein
VSQIVDHPTDPEIKLLHLANGKGVAVIDTKYAAEVGRHMWCRNDRYAMANVSDGKGKWKRVRLHKFIAALAGLEGRLITPVDGGLDCRVAFMKVANKTECAGSMRLNSNNSSGYRGVSWHSGNEKWLARLGRKRLGSYSSLEDAARAYDAAARVRFDEFARLNFPGPGEKSVRESAAA